MTAVISQGAGWATPSYCSACHQNHPGACGCPCHLPAPAGRALPKGTRLLAAAAVTLTLAAGVAACQPAPGPATCPAGQQWVVVHGSWECSSGPDPATGACPPGKVTSFAPGKPLECSGKGAS